MFKDLPFTITLTFLQCCLHFFKCTHSSSTTEDKGETRLQKQTKT
uniref:Uncharacterized protein n=1 Tax=Anguilla anguilla TaxID=7936 RepID=A0A0E9WDH2_ANGAN